MVLPDVRILYIEYWHCHHITEEIIKCNRTPLSPSQCPYRHWIRYMERGCCLRCWEEKIDMALQMLGLL